MSIVHILTFQRALNYGAILQCFALYTTISKIAKCDVIDYRPSIIEDRYKIKNPGKNFKAAARSLLMLRRNANKRKKFDKFLSDNVQMSNEFRCSEALAAYNWSNKDAYCVGSDQVWNWEITGGDLSYMLSFAPNGSRKFSYAASVGLDLDSEHAMELLKKTSDFVGISVREKTTLDSMNNYGINCALNIDPVFLLKREQWAEISKTVKNEDAPYILIYLLQSDAQMLDKAKELAQKRNLRIVFISTGLRKKIDAEYVVDCGPAEFVSYFLNASVIFTNSFHGISFSILFNKEFYFNYQGNKVKTNSRLKNIIDTFNLSHQNILEEHFEKKIEYRSIEKIIDEKREEAIAYLMNCIYG